MIEYEGKCRFDTRLRRITHMSLAANATLPGLISGEAGKPARAPLLILELDYRDVPAKWLL